MPPAISATRSARCHSVGPVTGEPGTAGPGRPRVVIAEDSVLLLAGLTKLLESAGFVVAATAGEASGLSRRTLRSLGLGRCERNREE